MQFRVLIDDVLADVRFQEFALTKDLNSGRASAEFLINFSSGDALPALQSTVKIQSLTEGGAGATEPLTWGEGEFGSIEFGGTPFAPTEESSSWQSEFEGLLIRCDKKPLGPTLGVIRAVCVDYTWLMERRRIRKTYNALPDTVIIADLIATAGLSPYLTTLSLTEVDNSVSISFDNVNVREALDMLCELTGAELFVDAATLRYAEEIDLGPGAFGLSNAPDGVTTFGYRLKATKLDDSIEALTHDVFVIGKQDEGQARIEASALSASPPALPLQRTIKQDSLVSTDLATKRADIELAHDENPRTGITVVIDRDGLNIGQKIGFESTLFGVDDTYLIRKWGVRQESTTKSVYRLQLGDELPNKEKLLRQLDRQARSQQLVTVASNPTAIEFDGGANDRIDVPAAASINDLSALTLSLWMMPGSSIATVASLLQKLGTTFGGWGLDYHFPDNQLRFVVSGQTGQLRKLSATGILDLTRLSNVIVTWAGGVTDHNAVKIYVDGVETAYGTSQNGSGSFADASNPLRIGGRGPDQALSAYTGLLSQVALWSSVLSETDIQSLALSPKVKLTINQAALRGYWILGDYADGATVLNGSAFKDSSSQGNSGSLNGQVTSTEVLWGPS